MKRVMAGLRAAMKADVDALGKRVDEGFADHRAVHRRVIATLVRLEGKFDDMAERMAAKDDISALDARIDGLAGRLDDFQFRWASHEERIAALEKRRS